MGASFGSGSRPTDQAPSGLAGSRVDPSRKQRWAAFDKARARWSRRNSPPAFVQGVSAHSWCIQELLRPPLREYSRFHRWLNDPPSIDPSEPYYNGWPGDRRGWMHFPTKEAARDFYQMANGFISFEEYCARPHEPLIWDRADLDDRGEFALAGDAK